METLTSEKVDSQGRKIVMTTEQYQQRVVQAAREIIQYYKSIGVSELVCVGILKGVCVFIADLVRKIHDPQLVMDFMCIDNGGGGEKGKTPIIRMDIDTNIQGKHVLIVDDCSDRNKTLKFAREYLLLKNPESVEICVMISKSGHPDNDGSLFVRFPGFGLGPNFIEGCGLDGKGGFSRNLPYVVESPQDE